MNNFLHICESLNPAQIPAKPPNMLNRAEDTEIELSPQSMGRAPPSVEPTIAPSQMIDFVFIIISIARFRLIPPMGSYRLAGILQTLSSSFISSSVRV